MEFGLLGVLSVTDQGVDRAPTAPKQRQMLALLLLNANHVVSMTQFVEELWEANPPPSAVAAVHTYVMQMRRALQEAGELGRLITREQGYQLDVRPGELDLDVFKARVEAARDALARNDNESAAERLWAALSMWRAQVLADVTAGPLLRAAIAVIEQDRLDATGLRIGAELRLGRHHELIGELSGLVHQHPAHEDLAAQLMVALYRSGRQVDALDVFHRLREILSEDFGSVPSRRMHRLYTDILAAHPRLEIPSGTRPRLSLDLVAALAEQGAPAAC
jgi:DNA-binding SARP family transcriptional activator